MSGCSSLIIPPHHCRETVWCNPWNNDFGGHRQYTENHPSARTDLSRDGPEVSLGIPLRLWWCLMISMISMEIYGHLWLQQPHCNSPMSVPCRSHVDQRLRWNMMVSSPRQISFLDDFAKKNLGLKPRLESLVSLTHANQLVIQIEDCNIIIFPRKIAHRTVIFCNLCYFLLGSWSHGRSPVVTIGWPSH